MKKSQKPLKSTKKIESSGYFDVFLVEVPILGTVHLLAHLSAQKKRR